MASVFDSAYIGKFAHLRWPAGCKGQWILWPAWFCRVSAPTHLDNKLGPFERAVLNCAKARISDAQHISELLCIDHRLVKLIQDALREKGALELDKENQWQKNLVLTESGNQSLDTEIISSNEIQTVYIFTSAISKDLIRRCTPELSFVETVGQGNSFQIKIQNKNNESNFYPCLKITPPDNGEPTPPEAKDVLSAQRKDFEDRKAYKKNKEVSEDFELENIMCQTKGLTRVNLIDKKLSPIYLATIAYVNENNSAYSDLRIMDPFGIGESRQFLMELDRLRRTDLQLDNEIKKLTTPTKKPIQQIGVPDAREVWEHCKQLSEEKLLKVLWDSEISTSLIALEKAIYDSKLDGIKQEQKEDSLAHAGVCGRKAFEAILIKLSESFLLTILKKRIDVLKYTSSDIKILNNMTQRACVVLELDQQIPDVFWNVKIGALKAVIQYKHYSKLAAAILATLLVAAEYEMHPLRALCKQNPLLLADLAKVLSIGGEAAHHGEKPSVTGLDFLTDQIYVLANKLLGEITKTDAGMPVGN